MAPKWATKPIPPEYLAPKSGSQSLVYKVVFCFFLISLWLFKEQRNCRSDTTLKESGLSSGRALQTQSYLAQDRGGKKRFDPSSGRHLGHEIDRH